MFAVFECGDYQKFRSCDEKIADPLPVESQFLAMHAAHLIENS